MVYQLRMLIDGEMKFVGHVDLGNDVSEKRFSPLEKLVLSPYTNRKTEQILGFIVDQIISD